jgi:putative ABC transport system permease protein
MSPDWRAIVRERLASPDLEREPEILDELAQHLNDLHDEALAGGKTASEAEAVALGALEAERNRLERDVVAAKRSLPGLITDRWTASALGDSRRTSFWSIAMTDLRRDVVYAIRSLSRSAGYALVAFLTLALGIGATSAIFAAVDTILLRRMPYANADRLVVPVSINTKRGGDDGSSVSYADYEDWLKESSIFESVALWRPIQTDLTGAGDPERITAIQVSAEFFRVMEVAPVLGRIFVPADHGPEAARVTLLTHKLWQQRFGGASDVVGRQLRLGGTQFEVAGVLPAGAVWPDEGQVFTPLRPARLDAEDKARRDNMIFLSIARLKPGVEVEQANAAMAAIASRVAREFPSSRADWTNAARPLRSFLVDKNVRRTLWVLLAAVGAVLLIGCANLAHLGLIRGVGRARELGVRVALGASRWRLVRQLGVECLILAVAGGIAGAGLASMLIRALVAIAPAGTPFIDQMALDGRVLAITTFATLVSVLLAGVLPAIAGARVDAGAALKDGSASAGTSRRVHAVRQLLIIGEVAGAVVLVISAALLVRSFWRVQNAEAGVDVDRVVSARVSLPNADRYSTSAQSTEFFSGLIARIESRPGVASAAVTSFVPVGGGGFGLGRVFLEEGWPEPPAHSDVSAQWNVISPSYFATMGIPVLQGRAFTADDRAASEPVVIVSRSFARSAFGNENPLGRRIRSWRDENLLRRIVGIVDEVRYEGLAETEEVRQVYVPHAQQGWGFMNIVVRSAGSSTDGLAGIVRAEVKAADPELALSNVEPMKVTAAESIAATRYTAIVLSLLGSAALALGAIGIYGVISHAFSMRRREFGLRAALGASPRTLVTIVIMQGMKVVGLGLVLGVAGALIVSKALAELLYETPARDPLAYGATIAVVIAAAAAACLGPARRAATVDPLSALRGE